MPHNIKRIGVLTGGGDCPGLNAVIRAVTKTAIWKYGIEVVGIEDGFQGLIEDRVRPLSTLDVSGILTRGGTILGSNNRCNPRKYCVRVDPVTGPVFEDVIGRCVDTARRHALDAIIVIGGDGTMAAAAPLVEAGINIIGVPKTIDNDIVGSEITFGFLTAVNTATEALDKLHSTADSHHRVMVCEVMGRNAGWIALTAGVASGSDVILLPEIPFDLRRIADDIDRRMLKETMRIARSLQQELRDHVERLVRVVDEDILHADRGEDVAIVLAHALREARFKWPEDEIRAAVDDQLLASGLSYSIVAPTFFATNAAAFCLIMRPRP
jgi:6-phosphofructokinase 1